MILEAAIFFVCAVICVTIFIARSRSQARKKVAPGPSPYPLIGNLADLVGKPGHVAMTELAEQYGKIYTIYMPGGERCIVVNSIDLAREALLTKRDDFSGRPATFIAGYLSRGLKDIICADFTQTMIYQRKIAHSALRMYGSGLKHLEAMICSEVENLAQRISARQGKPFDPKEEIQLAVLNVICAMVYGESYEIDDEEFVRIVKYNDEFIKLFGSYNILDLLPWLRFFPLKDMKRLRDSRAIRDEILDAKFQEHKQRFEEDNANNNFEITDLTDALLKAHYEAQQEDGKVKQMLTEDHIVMTMNDVFNAGLETSSTTLRWLVAYMASYPEIQARIHAELDDVIGSGRFPRLSDRGSLPYLESTIAEVLRIRAIVPLSLPHKSTCDTSLGGYDVPKDTMLITNIWAIHHDPDEWDKPEEFNPERFLDSNGKFSAAGVRSYLPFGAGRRGCLGESLAKTEIFLIAARLLHQFTITNPPGTALPDLTGQIGVVLMPGKFEVCMSERV